MPETIMRRSLFLSLAEVHLGQGYLIKAKAAYIELQFASRQRLGCDSQSAEAAMRMSIGLARIAQLERD